MQPTELVLRLNKALADTGLTVEQLATRAAVSRQTVWRILTGITTKPHSRTLQKLAYTLGLTHAAIAESATGQYEMVPLLERLPEDDSLFLKALRSQLETIPEPLRLAAVRSALAAMAAVSQEPREATLASYSALRRLERSRWSMQRRGASTS
jgi:transcriptional regulator with XRE-family HTH domain